MKSEDWSQEDAKFTQRFSRRQRRTDCHYARRTGTRAGAAGGAVSDHRAVGMVSPQFLFYPKAGHVANRQAKIVAKYIAERAAGREPKYLLPDNLCYMMVSGNPQLDVSVQFDYKVDEKGAILQTQVDDNERRSELVIEDFGWARNMYEDMFG
jgi:hypothetical protein